MLIHRVLFVEIKRGGYLFFKLLHEWMDVSLESYSRREKVMSSPMPRSTSISAAETNGNDTDSEDNSSVHSEITVDKDIVKKKSGSRMEIALFAIQILSKIAEELNHSEEEQELANEIVEEFVYAIPDFLLSVIEIENDPTTRIKFVMSPILWRAMISSASRQLGGGKYPLHLISELACYLVDDPRQIEVLVSELAMAYPGVLMIKDGKGRIPFEAGVRSWIRGLKANSDARALSNNEIDGIDRLENILEPTYVNSIPNLEFSLHLVSAVIERIENEAEKFEPDEREHAHDLCRLVVHSFSEFPYFVPTLLQLDRVDERDYIFSHRIVKEVLVDDNSISSWLLEMLLNAQSKGWEGNIMYYFQKLSVLVYGGSSRRILVTAYKNPRSSIENKLMTFESLLPAISAMDGNLSDTLVNTPVIKGMMNATMRKPFFVVNLYFDIIVCMIALVAHRLHVHNLIRKMSTTTPFFTTVFCGIYLVLIETGKFSYILKRERFNRMITFYQYFSFLSLTSLASGYFLLISTLLAEEWLEKGMFVVLATTTLVLWLKILAVTRDLSFNVARALYPMGEILRNVLVVLLLIIFTVVAFSQVLYTFTPDDFELSNDYPLISFIYLITFDFLLDVKTFSDLQASLFFMALFIVIVGLYLSSYLVATILTSFSECQDFTSVSIRFAVDRLHFITKLAAFEKFMKKGTHLSKVSVGNALLIFAFTLILIVEIIIISMWDDSFSLGYGMLGINFGLGVVLGLFYFVAKLPKKFTCLSILCRPFLMDETMVSQEVVPPNSKKQTPSSITDEAFRTEIAKTEERMSQLLIKMLEHNHNNTKEMMEQQLLKIKKAISEDKSMI